MIDLNIALLIALFALITGAGGSWLIMRDEHRKQALENRVAELEAERQKRNQLVIDAKGRQRSHHSWNTVAALEDSTSLLIDAEMDVEAMKARIQTTLAILETIRQGPGAYDRNKPEK